ncbi:hypothetical protein H1R20_g9146, partial [Candolleomyces eurysporus]
MIIFRVTTGRSLTNFPSVKDGVLTDPVQFARRAAELNRYLQSENLRVSKDKVSRQPM